MNQIITSNEFPPNIHDIRKALNLSGDEIFTYGKIIYNPNKKSLTPDLINHESLHIQQQGDNPDNWWRLYLLDKIFRCSQELPCFQIQYLTAKKYIKDRNRLHAYAVQLAKNLSSETYGNMMNFTEAMNQIKAEVLFDVRKLANK